MKRQYLVIEEVAERYLCSVRAIHGRTKSGRIPHRKFAGMRPLLFDPAWLDAYDAGAPLEMLELEDGGRVVRPRTNGAGA